MMEYVTVFNPAGGASSLTANMGVIERNAKKKTDKFQVGIQALVAR
jgi:hypothetical protein